ncbi:hypothetical protein KJ068_21700 [bacterium]|nr:hypothetical protein [bacterium]
MPHMFCACYIHRRLLPACCHVLLTALVGIAGGIHLLPAFNGSRTAAHSRCAHGCTGVCCCAGATAGQACGEKPASVQNDFYAYASCGASTPQELVLMLRWEALPRRADATAPRLACQDLHFFFVLISHRDFTRLPPDPPPRWS